MHTSGQRSGHTNSAVCNQDGWARGHMQGRGRLDGVRRASDREETSRDLQEFLPKAELMGNRQNSQPSFPSEGSRSATCRVKSGASGGLPGGGRGPLLREVQWDGLLSEAGTR